MSSGKWRQFSRPQCVNEWFLAPQHVSWFITDLGLHSIESIYSFNISNASLTRNELSQLRFSFWRYLKYWKTLGLGVVFVYIVKD